VGAGPLEREASPRTQELVQPVAGVERPLLEQVADAVEEHRHDQRGRGSGLPGQERGLHGMIELRDRLAVRPVTVTRVEPENSRRSCRIAPPITPAPSSP
jgi:hypothetical protein